MKRFLQSLAFKLQQGVGRWQWSDNWSNLWIRGYLRAHRQAKPMLGVLIRIQTLFAIALASLFVFAWLSIQEIISWQRHTNTVDLFSEISINSQTISKETPNLLMGSKRAAQELTSSIEQFDRAINVMLQGGSWKNSTLEPTQAVYQPRLSEINSKWGRIKIQADFLIEKQPSLWFLGHITGQFNRNEKLEALLDSLGRFYQNDKLYTEQIYVYRLSFLSQRIARNINLLLIGDQVDQEAAYGIIRDARSFNRIIDTLQDSNAVLNTSAAKRKDLQDVVSNIKDMFTELNRWLDSQQNDALILTTIKTSERAIIDNAEQIRTLVAQLQSDYLKDVSQRPSYGGLLLTFALLVLSGGGGALFLLLSSRKKIRESLERNQKIDSAVDQLVSEMQAVSQGNFTVRSSIDFSYTQKIALALNQTLQDVCKLIVRVRMASDVVTKTSLSTQKAATDLQNASNQQLENMFMLSQRVATMSHQNREALKKVSAAVSDSKRATDVSADGIETIRVAIGGILMLRDQIHSASRRIKKLGETSQRIGESVHLMGDITDETNRLALNTAIQASAGSYANDVGLLAQNIQHLANRSGRVAQLTKHHVTQVQLDTREVIKAMEECLAGVVRGATYSDEALVRLEEIGRTSERLLKTIELFAHNTQSHVEVSEKIMLQVRANLASSQNMMVSTREINLLIRQLNYLAEQLIVAVSKFRVK